MILQTIDSTIECRGCDADVSRYSMRRGFPYCLRCCEEIDALRDIEWRRRHRGGVDEHRSNRVLYAMAVVSVLAVLLFGCSAPTGVAERWVVECYDVWGRETTALISDYNAARDWRRKLETRTDPNRNPMVCDLWTEEEWRAQQ